MREHRAGSAVDERGDVAQGEHAAEQEQAELDGIRPDHGLDAADVGVEQRERYEQENGAEDGVAGAEAEQLVAQHQLHRDAGDIDAHAGRQGFAERKNPPAVWRAEAPKVLAKS